MVWVLHTQLQGTSGTLPPLWMTPPGSVQDTPAWLDGTHFASLPLSGKPFYNLAEAMIRIWIEQTSEVFSVLCWRQWNNLIANGLN